MPFASVAQIQSHGALVSNTPAAELIWVQGHLDGQTSIPARELARTKKWRRNAKGTRKAALAATGEFASSRPLLVMYRPILTGCV